VWANGSKVGDAENPQPLFQVGRAPDAEGILHTALCTPFVSLY
jgi:hypothetical protein